MTMRTFKKTRGTTLIELLIAATLTGFILAGVYLVWAAMAKSWMTERVKTSLNSDLQIMVTRMKKEMRVSSGNKVFYYPSSSPYTALSFPIAIDDDGDNLLELDADDNIIWDRTIVYHLFVNGEAEELRKTVFSPRDNSLSAAQRQEQLDSVANTGDGSGTYNAGNAATSVISNKVKSFEIIPTLVTFDGYNSVLVRTGFVSFGSVVLSPGIHTFRFEVTGKSGGASDYKFGIDSLVLSPSGGTREGEELLPSTDSSGDFEQNEDLSSYGSWSGFAHMLYNSNETEDYIEFDVYHDEWIETNFDHADALNDGTAVLFDDSLSVPEIILQLDGMNETWTGDIPTGGVTTGYNINPPDLPSMMGMTLRTIVTADAIESKGERCRVLFQAHPSTGPLTIDLAYVEERISGQNGDSSTKQQLYFSNASLSIGSDHDYETGTIGSGPTSVTIPAGQEVYSNWVDFPVDSEKDYLISFYISNVGNQHYPSYFPATPTTLVNSYYRNGDFANTSTWSTSGTDFAHIVATAAIQVTHPATGIWTSQIYDTKIDDPDYGQDFWDDNTSAATDIHIFARSSDDPEMEDDPTWKEFNSSPGNIPGSFVGRYIQFKAELYSNAPYYETPQLKRNSIRWEGEETLIDIGGYFTQNGNYGIIKLLVDGQELSKSVELQIELSETYMDKEQESFISAEIQPRNVSQ